MTSRCVNPKRKHKWLRPVYLAAASLAVLVAAGDDAGARGGERAVESIETPVFLALAFRESLHLVSPFFSRQLELHVECRATR
jgi:hypothetical protein